MVRFINDLKSRFSVFIHSGQGRNVLTFLIFLLISTIFWFIMNLNNEVQHEFDVRLSIRNLPNDVTLISTVPEQLSVNVKDKGTSLFRLRWGNQPELILDYEQFQNNGRYLSMNNTQLTGALRAALGGTLNITEVRPDSLYLSYTTQPGLKKRVNLQSDITASPQHVISGAIELDCDTVLLFSSGNIASGIRIYTDSIILSGLTDTTYVEVPLIPLPGIKMVPEHVKAMIPVEPLIAKTRTIEIEAINVPENIRVLTFPSTVEVIYTVPMSVYNHDNYTLKAYADYDSLSTKLSLSLSSIPAPYKNISLTTDSVEFLVERRSR